MEAVEAQRAYEKFIKESKGLFGFFGTKKTELKSFKEMQDANKAYMNAPIGIKTVPIDKIVGSVQKYMDFDKDFVPKNSVIKGRWSSIYGAYVEGKSLPPVELYKIKDSYFVYDGNHRISVAKYLDFESIEAEIIEFIPTTESKENIIYREKYYFEKTTGIDTIYFTETGQYEKIKLEIKEYQRYKEKVLGDELPFAEASKLWLANIYTPTIKIIRKNDVLKKFEKRTEGDLFIYLLDHKYYESERAGIDVGYKYAVVDFVSKINNYKDVQLQEKLQLGNDVMRNLNLLEDYDKKKYLEPDLLKKARILEEETGIKFNHNFFILMDLDDYINNNNYTDIREAIKAWYKDSFENKVEIIKEKTKYLPKRYSKYLPLLLNNLEALFFSIQDYTMKYCTNNKGICTYDCYTQILDYIIEIYIPITEVLINRGVVEDEFQKKYYEIQSLHNYIRDYNLDLTMIQAAKEYIDEKAITFPKIHDWFLDKYEYTPKSDIIIDYAIRKFLITIPNPEKFKEVMEQEGKPKKYRTVFKLERNMQDFRVKNSEKDWVNDKVKNDIKKLKEDKDILDFFQKNEIKKGIKDTKKAISILDFYADILNYGFFIEKENPNIDILYLAKNYIKNISNA